MVKLFWWRGGPRFGNFGDELARDIVKQLAGRSVEWSTAADADLVSIGSLLEDRFGPPNGWNSYTGAVWGTGRFGQAGPIDLRSAQVAALSGTLTRENVDFNDLQNPAVGNPALLCSRLVERAATVFTVGVVPHWSQRNHPLFRSQAFTHPDVRFIDVCQPVRQVLMEIARCKFLLATSLHALVAADALQIPNAWLEAAELNNGETSSAEFRLRDYYSVFADKNINRLRWNATLTLDEVIERIPAIATLGLEEIQASLAAAFPLSRPMRATSKKTSRAVTPKKQSPPPSTSSPDHTASPPRVVVPNDDDLSPSRCVVLVPYQNQIVPACEDALRVLEQRGYTVRRVPGYAAIDQARNQLASDGLRDGFAETMWIDSDVGFHADDVDRLRSHRLPITCGMYPKKGQRAFACAQLPTTQKIRFGREGGLVEILYAGTGFLHVRREVYDDVQRICSLPVCNQQFGRGLVPYFLPLVHESESGPWYLAEDYAFSQRVRQCGYRILADSSIRLRHYGMYGYGWEDAGLARTTFDAFDYYFHDAGSTSSDQKGPKPTGVQRPTANAIPSAPSAKVAAVGAM